MEKITRRENYKYSDYFLINSFLASSYPLTCVSVFQVTAFIQIFYVFLVSHMLCVHTNNSYLITGLQISSHYGGCFHIFLPFSPDISIYCELFQYKLQGRLIAERQVL